MHELAKEMRFQVKGVTCANVSKQEEAWPVVETLSWMCREGSVGNCNVLGLYPEPGGLRPPAQFIVHSQS